jgi:hypothetical protein
VVNALRWLKLWGFPTWQRRLKRVQTRLGLMVRQTNNAYRIGLSKLAAIGVHVLNGSPKCNNPPPFQNRDADVGRL